MAREAVLGYIDDLAQIAEDSAWAIERDSLTELEAYERIEEAVQRSRSQRWSKLAQSTNRAMVDGWDGHKMATMLRERAKGYRSVKPQGQLEAVERRLDGNQSLRSGTMWGRTIEEINTMYGKEYAIESTPEEEREFYGQYGYDSFEEALREWPDDAPLYQQDFDRNGNVVNEFIVRGNEGKR